MPVDSASTVNEERVLTSAIMVIVGSRGVSIPGLDDAVGGHEKYPSIPLPLPEILLLSMLDRGDGPVSRMVEDVVRQTGTALDRLNDFLGKLAIRGLLIDRARKNVPPGTAPVISGPTVRVAPSALLRIATPRLFRLSRGRFEHIDADGRLRAQFSAVELLAVSEFRRPVTNRAAHDAHRAACGALALDETSLASIVARLAAAELLEICSDEGHSSSHRSWKEMHESMLDTERERFQTLNALMRQRVHDCDEAERERERHSGKRVRVVSVQENGNIFPLALGLIVATARAYDGGRLNDHYFFHPDWLMRPSKIPAVTHEPAVFLFSNYNWSHQHNMKVSRKAKQLSPWSITIHGGPNTPKYEADNEEYFRANPDVDITVHGEGEVAVAEILSALIGVIGHGACDLSLLSQVRGISYRHGARIVRTLDRARIRDLDSLPSPILTGLFDDYAGTTLGVVETNRGCPYSCTFCDWGSAIATQIRSFSLDRVFAELEWCARHQIDGVNCADANFGFFDRDVEIARKVAELKSAYGYPKAFSATYAKNTIRHTKRIVETLAAAGVISTGNIAAQSMDTNTLATIRRSNIRLEKYDELAAEFRKARLPLFMDLIFGLPGQTVVAFRNDLQECVNRNIFPRMYMTELLVNSPMNEPSYREQHHIQTVLTPDGSRRLVVSTSTFTPDEYEEMSALRTFFIVCDSLGMLRQIAHYVRSKTGMREIDFYERVRQDIRNDAQRWPVLSFSVRALPSLLMPPVSWYLAVEEAGRYLREVLRLEDDTSMRTVLAVQNAVLPARDRPAPPVLNLDHDYVTWYQMMAAAKEAGHRDDWPSAIPKLIEMGPASFSADDHDRICAFRIGSVADADLEGSRRRCDSAVAV